jgi:hypothetical protein
MFVKEKKIKQRSLSIICIANHLCLRVCLIDVGCQTIRHIETDIDRSIDREKKIRDNEPDNYVDEIRKTKARRCQSDIMRRRNKQMF